MYTVKRAAERLGCCVSVVYDLVNSGVLPHYRIGKKGCRGAIRIAEADLESYLASLRRGDGPKESVPPTQKRKIVLKHLTLKS